MSFLIIVWIFLHEIRYDVNTHCILHAGNRQVLRYDYIFLSLYKIRLCETNFIQNAKI